MTAAFIPAIQAGLGAAIALAQAWIAFVDMTENNPIFKEDTVTREEFEDFKETTEIRLNQHNYRINEQNEQIKIQEGKLALIEESFYVFNKQLETNFNNLKLETNQQLELFNEFNQEQKRLFNNFLIAYEENTNNLTIQDNYHTEALQQLNDNNVNLNERIIYLENELQDKLQYLPQIEFFLQESQRYNLESFSNIGYELRDLNDRVDNLEDKPQGDSMTEQELRAILTEFSQDLKQDLKQDIPKQTDQLISEKIITEINQNEEKIDNIDNFTSSFWQEYNQQNESFWNSVNASFDRLKDNDQEYKEQVNELNTIWLGNKPLTIDDLATLPVPQPQSLDQFRDELGLINEKFNDFNNSVSEKLDQTFNLTKIENDIRNLREDNKQKFIDLGLELGLIASATPQLLQNTSFDNLFNASKNATCNALNGGCSINPDSGSINNSLNNLDNKLDLINAGLNTTDLASTTAKLNKLQEGMNKLIDFTDNVWKKYEQTFNRLYNNLGIEKALNFVNTTLLLHNAMMLSQNVFYTLSDAVDVTLSAIGFKWEDQEGNQLEFSQVVGTNVKQFIVNLISESVYNDLITKWNSFNRIYQASANLLFSVRSLFDEVSDYSESILEGLNTWLNRAKKDGLVSENSYPDKPENVPPKSRYRNTVEKFIETGEEAEEGFDKIATISGNVVSFTSELNELKENKQEFDRVISEETQLMIEQNLQEKTASQINIEINRDDFESTY